MSDSKTAISSIRKDFFTLARKMFILSLTNAIISLQCGKQNTVKEADILSTTFHIIKHDSYNSHSARKK